MHRALYVLLLLVSGSAIAMAQPREVKLSPPEPVSRILPDTLRIQAADRYDDLTLVVWGSNRRLADGQLLTCLWAQLVRDSNIIGLPFLIHHDNARPARAVTVCASHDRFVVVWNDERKDAPGIYSTVIDTSGALLRPASLIITSRSTLQTFKLFAASDDEFVFVWSTGVASSHRTHVQTLTADGRCIGEEQIIGNGINSMRRMIPGIDGWLLHVDLARWYAVGRRVSRVRRMTAPVCEPFVVRDDGSVMTVCSDSLRLYASLFDTVVARGVRIPKFRGAALLASTPSISGDTTMLFGFTRLDTNGGFRQRLVSVGLDASFIPRSDSVLYESIDRPTYQGILRIAPGVFFRTPGCNNEYLMNACIVLTVYGYHGQEKQELSNRYVMIDGNGGARYGGNPNIGVCPVVPIARVRYDTLSSVSIFGDTVSVPTATLPVNLSERNPALDVSGDSVVIVWNAGSYAYVARHWPRYSDSVTSLIDSMIPPRIEYPRYQPSDRSSYGLTEAIFNTSGTATLLADHYRSEEEITPGGETDLWRYNYYACHTVSSSGWKRTVLAEGGGSFSFMEIEPGPHSHEPDSGHTTGTFGVASSGGNIDKHVVFTLDARGSIVDTISSKSPIVQGTLVLYDKPKQYLDCGPDEVRVIRRDSSFTIMRFDDSARDVWYQRLRHRQLLRTWRDRSDSTVLHVARYEIDGAAVGTASITLASKGGSLAYAEAADGRLFVVHADTSVNVYGFDPEMNLFATDLRISGPDARGFKPSAVVVRDTLVVVWEDHRSDWPDIYGAALDINEIPVRVAPEVLRSDDRMATAAPVPANGHLDITLNARLPDDAELDLLDADGSIRSHRMIDAGSMYSRLDLHDYPSGMYLLRIRSAARMELKQILIVR